MIKRIGIVGLGKLGLPLALAFASRGFKVIGVDINPEVIESIKAKRFYYEPGVTELLLDNGVQQRFSVTNDLEAAVLIADATIVIVATPSSSDGCFSLKYVLPVCAEIGKLLRDKDESHLVIVGSTVNPGDCENILRPELIKQSGKTDFGFCHIPEFIALGEILKGYLEPDHVLIGASDPKSASVAHEIYSRLCVNNPPIKQMSLVDTELAKIASNAYTILKTAFGNQIAELCENILGADVDEVTEAIGLDSRASPRFLKGATYAGGPCLPRDVRAILRIAEKVGVELSLIETIEYVNNWQVERLARMVQGCWVKMEDPQKVGILGLTYKPGVNVHEPSAGLLLLEKLYPSVNVVAYDPAIQIGQSVRTAEVLVEQADIVVVTTPWKVFENLAFRSGQVVIDCWRCLDQETVEKAGAEYIGIGRG